MTLRPGLGGMRARPAKIVPRAEVLARAREHDDLRASVFRDPVELRLQRRKHRGGQRVHAITAIERQRRHAVLVLAQDMGRFDFSFGWCVHGVLRYSIAEADVASSRTTNFSIFPFHSFATTPPPPCP